MASDHLFLMFQVCSWNVRGLNNQGKRSLVKFVVSKFKKSILCFQESKVEAVSRSFLRSFAGIYFDKCHFVKSGRASGGIITCWSSHVFSCSEVLIRQFSLTVRLKCLSSGAVFYVTNVYRPPSWQHKEEFCSELAGLKGVCGGLWVICGDFNLTRNMQERRGRCWSIRLMAMFTDLINTLEMIDLPLGNENFTWSNMQNNPTLAKLDRFLISTEWDQSFPTSKARFQVPPTGRHVPCPSNGGTVQGGYRPPRISGIARDRAIPKGVLSCRAERHDSVLPTPPPRPLPPFF